MQKPFCQWQNGFFKNLEAQKDILEGCKRYDRKSQEKLYRQFYPALFALCKKFFDENHDVLTALNNGMMKVFKNINQYDTSKGELFNWIYTVVRNAALTLLRDKKTIITSEINDNIPEVLNCKPFEKSEWKDIYIYLSKLPPTTRAVCSLFYMEGFSIKEIGTSLEMKEGTIKWHLSESRNKLKTIFEKASPL